MNLLQASTRLAGVCVAFGASFANASQTVAVTSPSASQLLSPAPPDASATEATKQLDGRLFFSEQERRRMDAARKRGLASGVTAQFAERSGSVLNGFVKRSDGISTIWVDGVYKPVSDEKMVGRIEPTSVGMDSNMIVTGDTAVIAKQQPPSRAKTRTKKSTVIRKPGYGISAPSK